MLESRHFSSEIRTFLNIQATETVFLVSYNIRVLTAARETVPEGRKRAIS